MKKSLAVSLLLLVLAVSAELAAPYLLQLIIDRHLSMLGTARQGLFDPGAFLLLLAGYAVALAAAAGFNLSHSYRVKMIALCFLQQVRDEAAGQLQRLPIRYFDRNHSGTLVSKVMENTEEMKQMLHTAGSFIVDAARIIFILVALLWLSPGLAGACLLLVLAFAAIHGYTLKTNQRHVKAARESLDAKNAVFSEGIRQMSLLQTFQAEGAMVAEYEAHNERWYAAGVKRMKLLHTLDINVNGLIYGLVIAGIVWFIGGSAIQSGVTFGLLYTLVSYVRQLFNLIRDFGARLMHSQTSLVAAERFFALLDEAEEAPGQPGKPAGAASAATPEHETASIQRLAFDCVSFGYEPGQPAVKAISFEARQGQRIAFVGHTGSGKSTLLQLLLGLYRPTSGRIVINGEDAAGALGVQQRRQMAAVLQDACLFGGSVAFNVALQEGRADQAASREALAEAGLVQALDALPWGWHASLPAQGGGLSAGQKQLLVLARALVRKPSVLLLDEATSNVDAETEAQLLAALERQRPEQIQIVAAHRLSTVRDADWILLLHHGEIAEQGTHEQLLALNGRYAQLYELQVRQGLLQRGEEHA